jgi:cold shock CspA family protein
MEGVVIWWSPSKSHGVISATEDGKNQRYFLLMSRIKSAPKVIKAGQFVKFTSSGQVPRQDLLPLASNVIISDERFVDTGLDTLKAGL